MPSEDSPADRNYVSKPSKELGEPGKRWESVNVQKAGSTGKVTRSGGEFSTEGPSRLGRLGVARQNSSLGVVDK